MLLGSAVGILLATCDGSAEGKFVGAAVGGLLVGNWDGDSVGALVGSMVGAAVNGAMLGLGVGSAVTKTVAGIVGEPVDGMSLEIGDGKPLLECVGNAVVHMLCAMVGFADGECDGETVEGLTLGA
jgi:hypothetical protein